MTASPAFVRDRHGSDVASGSTLWSLALRWADRRPSEDALVAIPRPDSPDGLETVSWETFVEASAGLRQQLAAAGVHSGAVVVVCLPNSPVAVALWLAVQANGAVVSVVDPDAGSLTLQRTITRLRPLVVVTTGQHAAIAQAAAPDAAVAAVDGTGVQALRRGLTELPVSAVAAPDAEPGQVAAMLPTSGTSGQPKFVMLSHHNVVMAAERLARNSGFGAEDRHYLCSPLFHTNAQLYLCAPPFATGGSIAITPRFSAGSYFDASRWMGATVSSMVAPPMRMALHRAVDRGVEVDPGRLRLIQYGMSLSESDWQAWDRLVPQVSMRQIYGQTESVTGVLGGSPWEDDDRSTIGRPFLGVEEVRLVAQDGNPAPDGAPGELWVKGDPGRTLMVGYHDDLDATIAAMSDGWLRTGDVMVRHPNGRYEFRGRNMHIIRRGGENLSTYALELDLQSSPMVDDVAVTAQEDETLDALVVAHVIPGDGFDEDTFRSWCLTTLGKRGVPDIVRLHREFPRTGSGRVIARELT